MDGFRGRATRRRFLRCTGAAGVLASPLGLPTRAAPAAGGDAPDGAAGGQNIDLVIARTPFRIGQRVGAAVTMNGTVPGPLLRLREGETVAIRVDNRLDQSASIHWHGVLVPPGMDGVPGVSFPGIGAGEVFTYRFATRQSGTYWYHSHSAFHEQLGQYGPLIIDPKDPDPVAYDREHVVMLSDWTFEEPESVYANLKGQSDYYNFQQRTLGDFVRDVGEDGLGATLADRLAWARMRMGPADIADITGYTYTYLINGRPPEDNWTALFRPGERVRLRFINGSSMTYFNVRIPGLRMTVVQADGQNVRPVTVDEFQIAVAETYDVIVRPEEDRAFTVFAEAMDRSGYTRGTLAPREGMSAPVPELRPRPLRTMVDMGMDMGAMAGMGQGGMSGAGDTPADGMAGMDMGDGSAATAGQGRMPKMPGMGAPVGPEVARHGPDRHGPGNTTVAEVERNRLGEPGTGLEDVGHRVLAYADLRSLTPGGDRRQPGREVEVHLTGNMEQFIWGLDGKRYSEADGPILFNYGERLRFTMVNDTMMEHPMHLHGMFMELDNGSGPDNPRKHTVNVKPAERLSVNITAEDLGNWAFHCHLLFHMEAGMFQVVNLSQRVASAGG